MSACTIPALEEPTEPLNRPWRLKVLLETAQKAQLETAIPAYFHDLVLDVQLGMPECGALMVSIDGPITRVVRANQEILQLDLNDGPHMDGKFLLFEDKLVGAVLRLFAQRALDSREPQEREWMQELIQRGIQSGQKARLERLLGWMKKLDAWELTMCKPPIV